MEKLSSGVAWSISARAEIWTQEVSPLNLYSSPNISLYQCPTVLILQSETKKMENSSKRCNLSCTCGHLQEVEQEELKVGEVHLYVS